MSTAIKIPNTARKVENRTVTTARSRTRAATRALNRRVAISSVSLETKQRGVPRTSRHLRGSATVSTTAAARRVNASRRPSKVDAILSPPY